MKPNIPTTLALSLLLHTLSLAQGPLTPPGAPAPTQKSLQEIWDKIAAQEAQITSLQAQNSSLQAQLSISPARLALPWNLTTVDSDGNLVGQYTSLAFGPDGQPAISYYDDTNTDLKFARKGIFKPAP